MLASVDVVVVGTGYGGAIAAFHLAAPGRRVLVLERGREYHPGDFPNGQGELPGHVRVHGTDGAPGIGYPDALWQVHRGADMDVLVGSGIGGTSLVNASVAAWPDADVFNGPQWPEAFADGALEEPRAAVERWLGVTPAPERPKGEALDSLAAAVGLDSVAAPVTVTHRNDAAQPACTGCGNCVTGCNVGAKNSLDRNLLPAAVGRGAELFSNAEVLSVEPVDGAPDGRNGWWVHLRRTSDPDGPAWRVRAGTVVLGGGALGSTGILLRSRARHGLDLPDSLGEGFSGNGDALAMGFAQAKPVHALGSEDPQAGHAGPTITRIARGRLGGQRVTLEDGAVPAGMVHLFGELVTTAAFLGRLSNPTLPGWFSTQDGAGKEALAVQPGALEHSQVLLVMSEDGGRRRISLQPAADPAGASVAIGKAPRCTCQSASG